VYFRIPKKSLLGGFNHLETYEFVNGKDDNPYTGIMENKSHVPKHQAVDIYIYIPLYNDSNSWYNIPTNSGIFSWNSNMSNTNQ